MTVRPGTTPQAASGSSPPQVQCDLCESPMPVPEASIRAGRILGLLVCTQCIEDIIHARAFEPRAEVGLVGSGGCRS